MWVFFLESFRLNVFLKLENQCFKLHTADKKCALRKYSVLTFFWCYATLIFTICWGPYTKVLQGSWMWQTFLAELDIFPQWGFNFSPQKELEKSIWRDPALFIFQVKRLGHSRTGRTLTCWLNFYREWNVNLAMRCSPFHFTPSFIFVRAAYMKYFYYMTMLVTPTKKTHIVWIGIYKTFRNVQTTYYRSHFKLETLTVPGKNCVNHTSK